MHQNVLFRISAELQLRPQQMADVRGGRVLDTEEVELVRRMKKGERTAFDALYARYYDRLYRTACMITGNQADGEDVTQETFIKM